MCEVEINNVSVKFPFEPYQVQKEYMGKVIESLQNKQHAFLESPTGTGKTLSLLCATLAWIEKQKTANRYIFDEIPLVIYASRTHSQIKQAMKEMKCSGYGYMKAALVASRQQLCINDDLKELSNAKKIRACDKLRGKQDEEKEKEKENMDEGDDEPEEKVIMTSAKCPYYENFRNDEIESDFQTNTVMDIEDLVKRGKELECCPYFASKKFADQRPDILFMPYNYLLDPKIRFIIKDKIFNSIIIFDEAHNVSKICEENASTNITTKKISDALKAINYIIGERQFTSENNLDEIAELKSSLQTLKSEIENIKVIDSRRGDSYDADYMFSLLQKANINEDNISSIHDTINKSLDYLDQGSRDNYTEDAKDKRKDGVPNGAGLRAIDGFLSVVFSSYEETLKEKVKQCFKVHIERHTKKGQTNEQPSEDVEWNKIHFWCFSPIFGMQYLLKRARNLIMTSGTLSPLDSLIAEMEIANPIKHISKHVIQPEQVYIKVVNRGPDGESLNSCYNNRDNENYLQSLGKTIIEFAKNVPYGMLVFFPSYSFMHQCTDFWRDKEIWSQIESEKSIFTEDKEDIQAKVLAYYATIDDPNSKGAIFMAVMRGKVSEGLDFANKYGRAVIVTGIPLAPCMEPKIKLKRSYQNENRTIENGMLSGYDWYNLDGMRACNQAIGRVIRHKDDYGSILLCDERFNNTIYSKYITTWIRNQLNAGISPTDFNGITQKLDEFYEESERSLPIPVNKLHPEINFSDKEFEETSDMDDWDEEEDAEDVSRCHSSSVISHQDDTLPGTSKSKAPIKSSRRKRMRIEYISDDDD